MDELNRDMAKDLKVVGKVDAATHVRASSGSYNRGDGSRPRITTYKWLLHNVLWSKEATFSKL